MAKSFEQIVKDIESHLEKSNKNIIQISILE